MLVKVNKDLFVLASNVVSVKRITKTASGNYGEWVAVVKHEGGEVQHLVPRGKEEKLVLDINEVLGNKG